MSFNLKNYYKTKAPSYMVHDDALCRSHCYNKIWAGILYTAIFLQLILCDDNWESVYVIFIIAIFKM